MSAPVAVIIAFAVLLVLLATATPVAFSLATAGAIGLLTLTGLDYTQLSLGSIPYRTPSSFALVVVPLFIVMGTIARQSRIAEDSFRVASRALRRVPGGLAVASVFACAGFAAVSGSSVATVAAVGPLATTEMRQYGYSRRLCAGVVASAGTLGVLIPPSVILVLFGIVTQQSVGQLLIAGIIPGIVTAVIFAVGVVLRVWLVSGSVGEANQREFEFNRTVTSPEMLSVSSSRLKAEFGLASYVGVLEIAVLFVIVIGGIYSGIFTATESAAVGALAAVIMLGFENFKAPRTAFRLFFMATLDGIKVSAMSFALLIGAGVFTAFLVLAGAPQAVASFVVDLAVAPVIKMLLLIAIFIPLGMFLDSLSIILVAVPLTFPAITALGYDGIWFGVIVVLLIEIGLITPPVGISTFVVAGVMDDCEVEEAFRGIFYFLPLLILSVGLLIVFPSLATWLPSVMGG